MAKKELAWGYTTGTCAQAATKAAMEMMLTGRRPERIRVIIPNGQELDLKIEKIQTGEPDPATGLPCEVSCAVKKDSGDDPDVTDGVLVFSRVWKREEKGILLKGGAGIGRITKEGLSQPVGSPAINPIPRAMILKEVREALEEVGADCGVIVEISIPEGVELAKKTFNPRLGIEGGLSVLGTSGRVEPMSEQALIETIRLEMQVKRAEGRKILVTAPGNYGLEFLQKTYGILEPEVVKCSNYIGQTVDLSAELGFSQLLLAGHIGKLVKVAGGIMNTHSRWADCRMELLACGALRAGLSRELAMQILGAVTTDEALGRCTCEERTLLAGEIVRKIQEYLDYRAAGKIQVEAVIYTPVYGILGQTNGADELLRNYGKGGWTDGRQIIRSRSGTGRSGASDFEGVEADPRM